jgi:hypothetical protein
MPEKEKKSNKIVLLIPSACSLYFAESSLKGRIPSKSLYTLNFKSTEEPRVKVRTILQNGFKDLFITEITRGGERREKCILPAHSSQDRIGTYI